MSLGIAELDLSFLLVLETFDAKGECRTYVGVTLASALSYEVFKLIDFVYPPSLR